MRIQVTQKHINKGRQGSCTHDPIALAMINAGFHHPWVSPSFLGWQRDNRDFSAEIPEEVVTFIKCFDTGQYCWPFEFELEG